MLNPFINKPNSPFITKDQPIVPYMPLNPYNVLPANLSASIDLNYSEPYLAIYENIDNDPKIIKRVVRYFYYKTLDKWLYKSMIDILGYLITTKKGIKVIVSTKKYKKQSMKNEKEIIKKIKFIENELFDEKSMRLILKRFLRNNEFRFGQSKLTWSKLLKLQKSVKRSIYKQLEKHMESLINDK
jgi:hypothetical protein